MSYYHSREDIRREQIQQRFKSYREDVHKLLLRIINECPQMLEDEEVKAFIKRYIAHENKMAMQAKLAEDWATDMESAARDNRIGNFSFTYGG